MSKLIILLFLANAATGLATGLAGFHNYAVVGLTGLILSFTGVAAYELGQKDASRVRSR